MTNAELKVTHETGLLRGGREGINFFTNSASLDAKRAQQRLGLEGPMRDVRVRFRINGDVEISLAQEQRQVVGRAHQEVAESFLTTVRPPLRSLGLIH